MMPVTIASPRIGISEHVVRFLVDTGSAETTLHPEDAVLALGIDGVRLSTPYIWPDKAPAYGIGGAVEDYIEPVEYMFIHEDGTAQTIRGHIRIAQLTAYSQHFPSLLGWDVLRHFRITIDSEASEVTLASR
jgi:hypothetical protein